MQPWQCSTPGLAFCPYANLYQWMKNESQTKLDRKAVIDVTSFSEKLAKIDSFDPRRLPIGMKNGDGWMNLFSWTVNLGAWECSEYLLKRWGGVWGEVSGPILTPLNHLLEIFFRLPVMGGDEMQWQRQARDCRRILHLLVEKSPSCVNMTAVAVPWTPLFRWLRAATRSYVPRHGHKPRRRLSDVMGREMVQITTFLISKGAKLWPIPEWCEDLPETTWMCQMPLVVQHVLVNFSFPLVLCELVIEFSENPLIRLFGVVSSASPLGVVDCSSAKQDWSPEDARFVVQVLESALNALHGNSLPLPLVTFPVHENRKSISGVWSRVKRLWN